MNEETAKVMRLTARKILGLSLKTMEDAFAAAGAMDNSVYDWPVINRERGLLIDKNIAGNITPEESLRLSCLNAYTERYVELTAPRPTQMLERAETDATYHTLPTDVPGLTFTFIPQGTERVEIEEPDDEL